MLKSSASKQEPPASKQEPPASKQEPPASKQEPPAAESDERSEEQPPEGQGQDTQQTPPAQAPTAQHGTRKGHTGHHQSEEQQVALRQVSAELSLLERVEAIWPDVVRDVKPHDMKLQAILNDVHPVNVEGNTVILQARSYFHFSQVEKNLRSHQIVEEVLSQHMGQRFGMRCVYQEQEKPEDLRSQIQSSLRDPHVKAARNIFSADVIDIEPAET
jgi:hypothetical protein